MSKITFKKTFSSYRHVTKLQLTNVIEGGWVDVYSEFTFAKLGKHCDIREHQASIHKFAAAITGPVSTKTFLKLLNKYKVFILKGKLMQLMVLAVFKYLGIEEDDTDVSDIPSCIPN